MSNRDVIQQVKWEPDPDTDKYNMESFTPHIWNTGLLSNVNKQTHAFEKI